MSLPWKESITSMLPSERTIPNRGALIPWKKDSQGGTSASRSGIIATQRESKCSVIAIKATEESEEPSNPELLYQYTRYQDIGVISDKGAFFARESLLFELRMSDEGVELCFMLHREAMAYQIQQMEALPSTEEHLNEKSCCRRCCTDPIKVRVKEIRKSPMLQQAKDRGKEIIYGKVFPLISKFGRELAAVVQLFTALVILAMAIPPFVNDGSTIAMVRVTTASIALILALIDTCFSLRKCVIICKCKQRFWNKHPKRPHWDNTDEYHLVGPAAPPLSKTNKLANVLEKYVNDIIRLLIVEAILYINLTCDILVNASTQSYKCKTADECFHFIRFIFVYSVAVGECLFDSTCHCRQYYCHIGEDKERKRCSQDCSF